MTRGTSAILVGATIGFMSGYLGYGADTWQFWAFAVPSSGFYGFMGGIKNTTPKGQKEKTMKKLLKTLVLIPAYPLIAFAYLMGESECRDNAEAMLRWRNRS